MPVKVLPEPNEKQRRFFLARTRFVGYGGARGGGKSWAVRQKAKLMALGCAGIKILILRRTLPELKENHVLPLRADLSGIALWRETDRVFLFPNGSRIKFGYCDGERDVDQYQGQEFDVIFMDEATHFTEYQFSALTACIRGANSFPKRMYLTCNPGGPGHAWVKRLFIERRYKQGENPEDYTFIPARVYDNRVLMEKDSGYVDFLRGLPEDLRRAWLDGDWDVFAGQVFREWRNDPAHYDDRKFTHVIAPFPVPDGWRRYRTLDWGYTKPFSIGYYAVDSDGMIIRYHEIYGTRKDERGLTAEANEGVRLSPGEVARLAAAYEDRYERGHRIFGIADPSIFDESRGSEGCVASLFAKEGIYFERGDNKRIPGKLQVHNRLHFDKNGVPGLQVFSTCHDCIRTLPALQYDRRDPEDVDSAGEDHIYDELRYLCMALPVQTPKETETVRLIPQADPLNLL